MKFKLRSDHNKTKVYQNPLDTCPGFFVNRPWFRKYKFSKIFISETKPTNEPEYVSNEF